MLDHNRVIREWLVSTHDVLSPPPRVQAALEQRARIEEAAAAHWIDWSEQELEGLLEIVDQQRLEFEEEDTHANVRAAIARYLETVVAPAVADPIIGKLSARLREARQHGTIMYHPERKKFVTIWDQKAGLPLLCPDDAREEAMRVQRRVVPAVLEQLKHKGARAYYAVFTVPDAAPGKLRAAMRALFRRFNQLMRDVQFAQRRRQRRRQGARARQLELAAELPILGAYAVLEAPLSHDRDWHPHLNVIFVTSGWFDYAKLREYWHWNVEVRRLEGKEAALAAALRELIKYSVRAVPEKSAAKQHSTTRGVVDMGGPAAGGESRQFAGPPVAPALIEWTADEFVEWWGAHQRFRRSRGYGCLYRLEDPDETESLEGFRPIGSVRSVGGKLVRTFPLLGSIPGDKSSGMSLRDRFRRAIERLLGPPDRARAYCELARAAEEAWRAIN